MIQQQKFGGSFLKTLFKIAGQYGIFRKGLCRGLISTVGRDTICVIGMLGITPIVSFIHHLTFSYNNSSDNWYLGSRLFNEKSRYFSWYSRCSCFNHWWTIFCRTFTSIRHDQDMYARGY